VRRDKAALSSGCKSLRAVSECRQCAGIFRCAARQDLRRTSIFSARSAVARLEMVRCTLGFRVKSSKGMKACQRRRQLLPKAAMAISFPRSRRILPEQGGAPRRHRRQLTDAAARAEAKGVIQRWNDQLAASRRDMLWSPTIRSALVVGQVEQSALPPRVRGHPGAGAAVLLMPRGDANAEVSSVMPPPAAKAVASNL
jgi:hypothetical protein